MLKLIYTVILWYSFVVQWGAGEPSLRDRPPAPPPPLGQPSRHGGGGDYKGGGLRYHGLHTSGALFTHGIPV